MEQNMFYYNYMMPNINGYGFPFPYFAPEGSQDLYVMVPTVNPMMFGNFFENSSKIKNVVTEEEEILPDFRCKICSVTFLTYSEFRAHSEEHEKAIKESLNRPPLDSYRSQTSREDETYTSKSEPQEEKKDSAIGDHSESQLEKQNVDAFFHRMVPEIISESIPPQTSEGYNNYNQTTNLLSAFNNLYIPSCPKYKTPLEAQSKSTGTEFMKTHSAKTSPVKSPKDHPSAFKPLSHVKAATVPTYANLKIQFVNHEKKPFSVAIQSKQASDKQNDNASTTKVDDSNKVPNSTYQIFKQALEEYKNKNAMLNNPHSSKPCLLQTETKFSDYLPRNLLRNAYTTSPYFSYQPHLMKQNSNVLKESNMSETIPVKMLDKQDDYISSSKKLEDMNTVTFSTYPGFKHYLTQNGPTNAGFKGLSSPEYHSVQAVDKQNDKTTSLRILDGINAVVTPTYTHVKTHAETKTTNINIAFKESNLLNLRRMDRSDKYNIHIPVSKQLVDVSATCLATDPKSSLDRNTRESFKECNVSEMKPVQSKEKRVFYKYPFPTILLPTKLESEASIETNEKNENVLFTESNRNLSEVQSMQSVGKRKHYSLFTNFKSDISPETHSKNENKGFNESVSPDINPVKSKSMEKRKLYIHLFPTNPKSKPFSEVQNGNTNEPLSTGSNSTEVISPQSIEKSSYYTHSFPTNLKSEESSEVQNGSRNETLTRSNSPGFNPLKSAGKRSYYMHSFPTNLKSEALLEVQNGNEIEPLKGSSSSEVNPMQSIGKRLYYMHYLPSNIKSEAPLDDPLKVANSSEGNSLQSLKNSKHYMYSFATNHKPEMSVHDKTENNPSNETCSSEVIPVKSMEDNKNYMSNTKPLPKTKNRPIRCSLCRVSFSSQFELTQHTIQHKSVKNITCVLCKSIYSDISSLRKHLQMFHCKNKDRRQCSYCNYRCFQTSDLEKHIARRHTRDFKFKCSYCVKGFATPKELNNHLRKKHLDIKAIVEACYDSDP